MDQAWSRPGLGTARITQLLMVCLERRNSFPLCGIWTNFSKILMKLPRYKWAWILCQRCQEYVLMAQRPTVRPAYPNCAALTKAKLLVSKKPPDSNSRHHHMDLQYPRTWPRFIGSVPMVLSPIGTGRHNHVIILCGWCNHITTKSLYCIKIHAIITS